MGLMMSFFVMMLVDILHHGQQQVLKNCRRLDAGGFRRADRGALFWNYRNPTDLPTRPKLKNTAHYFPGGSIQQRPTPR